MGRAPVTNDTSEEIGESGSLSLGRDNEFGESARMA